MSLIHIKSYTVTNATYAHVDVIGASSGHNIADAYKSYEVHLDNVYPQTAQANLQVEFRRVGYHYATTATYIEPVYGTSVLNAYSENSSDYYYTYTAYNESTDTTGQRIATIWGPAGNATGFDDAGVNGVMHLYDPASGGISFDITAVGMGSYSNGYPLAVGWQTGMWINEGNSIGSVRFLCTSGNLTGTFHVYGVGEE